MMSSKHPPTVVPEAAFTAAVISVSPATGTSLTTDDRDLSHVDYNLLPMAVSSLDHYVIRIDENERFHVI